MNFSFLYSSSSRPTSKALKVISVNKDSRDLIVTKLNAYSF
nr:MAG TPA: hypothetical protein [Caudoviricetes sp.]